MSSTLKWNSKVLAITVTAAVIVLYAGTSLLRSGDKSKRESVALADSPSNNKLPSEQINPGINREKEGEDKKEKYSSNEGGKKGVKSKGSKMDFRASDTQVERPVPDGILEASKTAKLPEVNVDEKHVEFETGGKKVNIFYREARGEKQPSVLLLHGMAFQSKNWLEVGTMQMLSRMGHRVVAVDLPGFGNSKEQKVLDKAQFLEDFITKLELGRPVIVSPSMSGSFALPFILGSPTKGCSSKVSGYVPIAPVMSKNFAKADYEACKVPVLIVYGSKDEKLGVTSAEHLKQFSNHKVFVIEGAGHPAWLHQPKVWNTALYNFMKLFEKA